MKHLFFGLFLLISTVVISQNNELTSELYGTYEKFKESSLDQRRIKYQDLQPLIAGLKNNTRYTVKKSRRIN